MAKKSKGGRSPLESVLGISAEKAAELYDTLTEREKEVADRIASGIKNRLLAKELGISSKTLDIHRINAKRKLNAVTVVDLVRIVYAKKLGDALN